MHRTQALQTAAIILGVIAVTLVGLSRQASATPATRSAVQGTGQSTCSAMHNIDTAPDVVLLGETLDVTMTFSAVCSAQPNPMHIVLVMDGSGSMGGDPNREMKKAAHELIVRLDLKNHPFTQVGVVQFNSAAKVLCQLTNRSGQVNGCIGRVGAAGGSNIAAGIYAGLRVLQRGRGDGAAPDAIREVMIVLADGEDMSGCGPVLEAADRVKGMGILLVTICIGAACDADCMRRTATSPRYFFEADDMTALGRILERIRRQVTTLPLNDLRVVHRVPTNMTLIRDSISPQPAVVGALGEFVEWRTRSIPVDGVTMTFSLRPSELGYWPTSVGASGVFTDSKGLTGRVDYPIPHVLVISPRSLDTATPTTAAPPTATPTPSPTMRPIDHRILLPIAHRGP